MFSLKPHHKALLLATGWVGGVQGSGVRGGVCLPAAMLQGSQGRRERLVGGCSKFASPGPCPLQPVCLSSL